MLYKKQLIPVFQGFWRKQYSYEEVSLLFWKSFWQMIINSQKAKDRLLKENSYWFLFIYLLMFLIVHIRNINFAAWNFIHPVLCE